MKKLYNTPNANILYINSADCITISGEELVGAGLGLMNDDIVSASQLG
jgi:hypothetical protein